MGQGIASGQHTVQFENPNDNILSQDLNSQSIGFNNASTPDDF
jgi:hypothetical protein